MNCINNAKGKLEKNIGRNVIWGWILVDLCIFIIPFFNGIPLLLFVTNKVKEIIQPFYAYFSLLFLCYNIINGIKKKRIKTVICNLGIAVLVLFCSCFGLISFKYLNDVIDLFGSISINLIVASFFIPFILCTGVVEYIAQKFEKIIKKFFHLPGEATISVLTGFVSSPSVGIYIAQKFYDTGIYSRKDTIAVMTNFSVVSIGFMGFMISTAKLDDLYGIILALVFFINLLLAFVLIRIPPISKIRSTYQASQIYEGFDNITSCKKLKIQEFKNSFIDTLGYLIQMISQIFISYLLIMILIDYTDILHIISIPITYLMNIFKIEDGSFWAQTLLLGGIDPSFVLVFMARYELDYITRFKIVVLAIIQVIFYTEPIIAMRKVSEPIEWKYIIKIFIERSILGVIIIELFCKCILS